MHVPNNPILWYLTYGTNSHTVTNLWHKKVAQSCTYEVLMMHGVIQTWNEWYHNLEESTKKELQCPSFSVDFLWRWLVFAGTVHFFVCCESSARWLPWFNLKTVHEICTHSQIDKQQQKIAMPIMCQQLTDMVRQLTCWVICVLKSTMCEQCANLLKYTKRKFVDELILQVFSTFPKCGAAKIVKFVTWDMRCLARL